MKKFLTVILKLLPMTSFCLLCGGKQPNIIVYMIDDLGWNQISAKQATMGTHSGDFKTPNIEKIANKDIKLRTFISQESGRAQLVSHVYDITYGVVREGHDALVCIDDSIVRGTTLKKSI
ncbi:MAG: hypothetical protein EBY43_06305, partial [Opitutae bacterium]|nr:hypothetical protein [Opitutae bacterium]